jgi:hypothetical protein
MNVSLTQKNASTIKTGRTINARSRVTEYAFVGALVNPNYVATPSEPKRIAEIAIKMKPRVGRSVELVIAAAAVQLRDAIPLP